MQRIWNLFFSPTIQAIIASLIVIPLLLDPAVFAQSTPPQSPGQLKATLKFTLRGHTGPIAYTVFSPDGRFIITMGYDETARIWDVNTGQPKAIIKLCPRCDTTDVAWSPDSTRILIHSSRLTHKDLGLTQVLTSDGKLQLTLGGHESELEEIHWSPDGRTILTAGADGKAILWDAETGRQKHALVHMPPLLKQTNSLISSILTGKRGFDESKIYAMFFADGKRVVTYTGSGNRGPLKLWDAETGALLSEFLLATLPDEMARPYMDNQFWTYWWSWLNIRHVSSPDRRLTVRHLKKQGYELIEVGTGNVIARDESNGFPISFSPDGKSLLFHQTFESKSIWGDPKTVISLRDLTTGQTKVVFNELREAGYHNYWSPSGHRVITGYRHLLDTNTGNMIAKLPYKCVPGALFGEDGCGDYTFSADGHYFTKDQKDVFIWSAENGQRLAKITGVRGQAAFSPTDARIFISNAPDKSTVLIWELSDQ